MIGDVIKIVTKILKTQSQIVRFMNFDAMEELHPLWQPLLKGKAESERRKRGKSLIYTLKEIIKDKTRFLWSPIGIFSLLE